MARTTVTLSEVREQEMRNAMAVLDMPNLWFLDYRDSGMAGTASATDPRAFAMAGAGRPGHRRAVRALGDILEQTRPDVLLTYDADGGYGHPDHVAAHQVAVAAAAGRVPRVLAAVRPRDVAAAALSRFPVPAGLLAAVPADLGYLVDPGAVCVAEHVRDWAPQRRAALAAHATQVQLIDGGFALSNRIAQPLLDVEYFALLAGEPFPAGVVADDVFSGLG